MSGACLLADVRDSFTWTVFGMSIAHLVLKFLVMWCLYGIGQNNRLYLPFYGLAMLVVLCAQASALRNRLSRRVMWRGTAYPQTTTNGPG